MSIRHARHHCADLRVLLADARRMERGEQAILRVVRRYAPVWEPTPQGGWWMDLTGTTRLFGRAGDAAARIQRDIAREHRLQGVAGVGGNKLVAQTAAALVAPDQVYEVHSGLERTFVAPLSIHALPVLHQPHMRDVMDTLIDLNLRTLGEIANVPLSALHIAVGRWAGPLSRWAMGIDPSPVILPRAQSQCSISCKGSVEG
jgi:DNA polymerase-4